MGRTSSHTDLGSPLFLLNLKAYPSSMGKRALRMGEMLEASGKKHGVNVAMAPSTAFLSTLAGELEIPILAQHADPFPPGAKTGFLIPAALKEAGVSGSLINHSEHPVNLEGAIAATELLDELGLIGVVCAGDVKAAILLARECRPRYLAIEPPELIGGNVSVSVAQPQVVSGTVDAIRRVSPKTRVLCGAGVKSGSDVRKAIDLGAEGVLVASAVASARNPKAVLDELLKGF